VPQGFVETTAGAIEVPTAHFGFYHTGLHPDAGGGWLFSLMVCHFH
jgi:hypothetical protein